MGGHLRSVGGHLLHISVYCLMRRVREEISFGRGLYWISGVLRRQVRVMRWSAVSKGLIVSCNASERDSPFLKVSRTPFAALTYCNQSSNHL